MNCFARYLRPATAAAMLAMSLAGCGVQESIKNADAEVARFHSALDAGQWQSLYAAADPDMRKATTAVQFNQMLSAVHRKLGKVRESKQVGWNANASTDGSFITVTMQTTFERGSGTEQFVYRKGSGDRLLLVGYNIQSREMMLN